MKFLIYIDTKLVASSVAGTRFILSRDVETPFQNSSYSKTHALICSVIWPNFVLMKGKFHRDAESISSLSFGDLFEEPIARYYQSPLTKAVSFLRHQVLGMSRSIVDRLITKTQFLNMIARHEPLKSVVRFSTKCCS